MNESLPYDYIVSLGPDCHTASALRRAGLRDSSGPFDWLTGASLDMRLGLLERRFSGFMEKGNLTKLVKGPNAPKKGNDYYLDEATGFRSYHDFREDVPFDEMYVAVREKYDRRINRLYLRVAAAQKVAFVWRKTEAEQEGTASMEEAQRRLKELFPGRDVRLVCITDDSELRKLKSRATRFGRLRLRLLQTLVKILSIPYASAARRTAVRRAWEHRLGIE